MRRLAGIVLGVTIVLMACAHAAATPPRCFGAAARDPQHPCANPRLSRAVTPTPDEALLTPSFPCTPRRITGALVQCSFGARDTIASVALIGDSHAQHWRSALAVVAAQRHWRVYDLSVPLCMFSTAVPGDPFTSGCRHWNEDVLAWLGAHPEIHIVFVAGKARESVIASRGTTGYRTRLDGYLQRWAQIPASVKSLIVIHDPPREHVTTHDCVRRALARRRTLTRACGVPRRWALPRDPAVAAARRLHARGVRTIDLTPQFCDTRLCYPVIGGALVHKDTDHLTQAFSRTLGPFLLRAFDRLSASAASLPARTAARSWDVAQINRLAADDSIDDLSMSLQGDGWAVGSNDTDRGSHPIVQRFAGGRWTWMSTRGLGHLEPSQVAAVSSTEAWAFGGAARGAFVAHWDGVRWSAHSIRRAAFSDAAALSRRNVWAVGPSAQGRPTRVAVHWNGVGWSSVRLPARANAIAATSKRGAWAVGNVSAGRVAIMRLHGSRWRVAYTRRVALPERDAVATLADVSASSSRDVWAVGGVSWACGIDGDDQCGRSLLLHYDGHRWSFTEGRRHGGSYTGYTKVAVDGAGGAWALASQWNPRLYHLVGTRVTAPRAARPEHTDMNLASLAFRSRDNTVWAAGFVAPVGDPPDPSANGIFLHTGGWPALFGDAKEL